MYPAEAPPRLESSGSLLGPLGGESAADLVAQLRSNSSPSMTRCAAALSKAGSAANASLRAQGAPPPRHAEQQDPRRPRRSMPVAPSQLLHPELRSAGSGRHSVDEGRTPSRSASEGAGATAGGAAGGAGSELLKRLAETQVMMSGWLARPCTHRPH